MGLLKWFNKDNYATLGEVLSVIRKELQALQPKDSSDIVWNLSEDGLSAQLRSSNVGSENISEDSEDTPIATLVYATQFNVIDASTYDEKGDVKELRVSVINGISPEGTIAGVLNGCTVEKQTLSIAGGDGKYYIYVIGTKCYALKHAFQSDFFPVLLCATVTIKEGKVSSIDQLTTENNPKVSVCGIKIGAVTLSGEIKYEDHVVTASYKAKATVLRNSLPITMEETDIPATKDGAGYLVAWIKELIVLFNEEPVYGISFSPPEGVKWTTELLVYRFTDTAFQIVNFVANPILPSFTTTLPYGAENERE